MKRLKLFLSVLLITCASLVTTAEAKDTSFLWAERVQQALANSLDTDGNWTAINFSDGTSQITAGAAGPGTSTDNAIARYDGTSGALQDSGITIDDNGTLTIATTNATGIVFGSLGTATKAIDLENSGLSGPGDFWIYGDGNDNWAASGVLKVGSSIFLSGNTVLSKGKGLIISSYLPEGTIAHSINAAKAVIIGNSTAVGSWGGDGVSNGSTTITDVGGAAHGLSLAAGDLVHITDSTTSGDEGFYRIVSDDGTNVVVDRTLSGSDTDLAVTFYKDVIGFFGTDGTNGQRIMNYSHQDKPLQIGGDTLITPNTNLGGEDVQIGNKIAVKGTAYFDGNLTMASSLIVNVGQEFSFSGTDAIFKRNSGDAGLTLALKSPFEFRITTNANRGNDHGRNPTTNPELYVFSATDVTSDDTQYISMAHNQTDGVIDVGTGTLSFACELKSLDTYSKDVGATTRDLLVDDAGLIGYQASSIRYKENVIDMWSSKRIYDLRPVSFNYKKDKNKFVQYGLIAEEVAEIMPEVVSYDKQGRPETVNYSRLIPFILNEMKNRTIRKHTPLYLLHKGVL